jgi:hypothetical protein
MLLQLFVAGYIAFHAASLQSMLADGPAFSSWDPVLTMVAVVVLAAAVVLTASRPRVHLVVCTLGAWALAAKVRILQYRPRRSLVVKGRELQRGLLLASWSVPVVSEWCGEMVARGSDTV